MRAVSKPILPCHCCSYHIKAFFLIYYLNRPAVPIYLFDMIKRKKIVNDNFINLNRSLERTNQNADLIQIIIEPKLTLSLPRSH